MADRRRGLGEIGQKRREILDRLVRSAADGFGWRAHLEAVPADAGYAP